MCRLSLFVGLSQFFPSVSLQLGRRLRRLACQLCGHTNASDNDKGVSRIFYWGQDRRPTAGGGFLARCSNPLPTSKDLRVGIAVSSPSGVRVEPRPPKGFPVFSALRMASPDTIILLIVDYHAAIGGKTPVPPSPLAYAPG